MKSEVRSVLALEVVDLEMKTANVGLTWDVGRKSDLYRVNIIRSTVKVAAPIGMRCFLTFFKVSRGIAILPSRAGELAPSC